ncbi:MAG: Ppx/GppA phosphatase family protein [Myxococcales bacterium]
MSVARKPPSPVPSAPQPPAPRPPPDAGPSAVAVIDIGSSAIRVEIAEVGPKGLQVLESLKRAVPLGRDSFNKGKIERRTLNLAIEILRGFQEVMRPYEVRQVRAVATSAVREASNQELFVERVYMATGISVEVITGAEEDRLLWSGVRDAFGRQKRTEHLDSLIVEQGAGHIDFARLEGGEVVAATSLSLGTLRLANAVVTERRAGAAGLDLMKRFVGSSLDEVEHRFPLRRIEHLVLLGGDARFVADRLCPGQPGPIRAVSRAAFQKLAKEVAPLSPEEIARRHGAPIEECESVVPGLLTYSELLKRTPAKQVLIPSVTLRDGLLLDAAAEQTGQQLTELDAQIYASAENLGLRYQYDDAHAHHVADLACTLFDALAGEHRLGRRERRLLRVAALVHDIGLFVGTNSHHKHSEYLVGASDIFGVRANEKAMVACIARYHRRALPALTHPGYATLSRQDRATVSKLAALLRIADALDRDSQRLALARVELRDDELVLTPDRDQDLALERLALRQKADLFEEVYGRKVVLNRSTTP